MVPQAVGRLLIIGGSVLIIFGVIFLLAGKIPGIGKLPGDFVFRKGNFTFYFPLATCLIISIIVSLILFFFTRK